MTDSEYLSPNQMERNNLKANSGAPTTDIFKGLVNQVSKQINFRLVEQPMSSFYSIKCH